MPPISPERMKELIAKARASSTTHNSENKNVINNTHNTNISNSNSSISLAPTPSTPALVNKINTIIQGVPATVVTSNATTPQQQLVKSKLELLREKMNKQKSTQAATIDEIKTEAVNVIQINHTQNQPTYLSESTDKYGNAITYNKEQQEFISLAASGKSCVLIGSAGTGKTTCMKGAITALIQSGLAGHIENDGHKHLVDGSPGILVVAYTRRAVNNIMRNMSEDMKRNCITIHKALEYRPEKFTVTDPETGEEKNKFQFIPARNEANPLPSSIRTIVFEESSMIGTPLFAEVMAACPHNPQLIFLGDICQLPPVFGPAILGFKLSTLPTVELTEVYRQALESPIIRLAHRILSGVPIPAEELSTFNVPSQLTLHPWKKKLHPDIALLTLSKFFEAAIASNNYDPEEDIILIPFNKSCGTDELNKHIADFIARRRSAVTYEIVAGYNKLYFAVGDK